MNERAMLPSCIEQNDTSATSCWFTASGDQHAEVTPAVPAVKFASVAVQALGAECFVERVRRIRSVAEEQHGRHALCEELPRHVAEQESADALALHPLKGVDLVQLSCVTRYAAIVRRPLRERDQLTCVVLDDETEPTALRDGEGFPPLSLSQFVGRPTGSATSMRFVERLHVEPCKRRNVTRRRLTNAK